MIDISKINLEKLSTQRLLAIKKKLYQCLWQPEDYVYGCKCDLCTIEKESLDKIENDIIKVKTILNTREHFVRKAKR